MTVLSYDRETVRKSLRQKIRRAAATAIHQEDVWAKYKIEDIPAERVVRHTYNPETRQFLKNETIVKIEKEPFTNGAMRHCFRLKKLATPPQSATNHRFHSYGWSRALNYVAKCYLNEQGEPDTNERDSVLTDIILQYEAAHWAGKYNVNAPKKIDFIRAYALEFVDRPGSPMFAVERFIAGKDPYGCGFLKHNTNSGFVDQEVRRQTPQVFSAHSFYASQGNRLVADIQGVGDLYTDPQVLSVDYRFGDGDLGPRGMALFFKNFRHCDLSDKMGIPIFPLSRNERKHQAKYEDDESTLSEGSPLLEALISKFRMLDDNRQMRKSILVRPIDLNCTDSNDTEKRNNFSDVSKTIRRSIVASKKKMAGSIVKRTKSDVDEVTTCLQIALIDAVFDNTSFHRYECGGLKPRHRRNSEDDDSNLRDKLSKRKSAALMKVVSPPLEITDETKSNLGKVHYHLAYLHGQDRFPEIVCPDRIDDDESPSHDIFSVVFHLSHAASLANSQACLALARARVGLQSSASPLLHTNVPIDFDSAKDLCRRAMASERAPASPKAAAGCLLYQILEDEETTGDVEKLHVLEETLKFLNLAELEQAAAKEHVKNMSSRGKADGFHIGDAVEGKYFMEGTYYAGKVIDVLENGNSVVVQYDDDGSSETLTAENVRPIEVSTEVLSHETSRLSDEEAFGVANTDEIVLLDYELISKIAELKEKTGDRSAAAELFQQAAELAMNAGKMQTANKWSMKAEELET
jgi:elongation factor 2 kinase